VSAQVNESICLAVEFFVADWTLKRTTILVVFVLMHEKFGSGNERLWAEIAFEGTARGCLDLVLLVDTVEIQFGNSWTTLGILVDLYFIGAGGVCKKGTILGIGT